MALREKVEAENRSLLTKLGRNELSDAIVGSESGLRAVMERVSLVARADIPVLIFGETGSGKEVVARAIHKQSRRDNGPFLRVNCGAIPPELVDSELFGHERGSFTGTPPCAKAGSNEPIAARCFSTNAASCRPPPKCGCCAFCKTARLNVSAASGKFM